MSKYKLYTDKNELFECSLDLKGTTLDKTFARLIVESNNLNILYNADIDDDGKCSVNISKLKNILGEGTIGNLKLEVIADDTYFIPWENEFIVETNKKVEVKMLNKNNVETKKVNESTKPNIKVTEVKSNPVLELKEYFINNNITYKVIQENKKTIIPIIKQYFTDLKIENTESKIKQFLKDIKSL